MAQLPVACYYRVAPFLSVFTTICVQEDEMKKLAAIALFLFFGMPAMAAAQAPSGPPKPGPEHEKLAYFAGKWTSEGEMKPSAFGPGGKFTFTETCEWFAGKFALICTSEGTVTGMTIKGTSVMSYDMGENSYVYFETNSMGENAYSRGTVTGDTWTWTGESKMHGTPVHSRFTLKQLSPDSCSYKFEMASGSDPMAVIMEGKQTRVK